MNDGEIAATWRQRQAGALHITVTRVGAAPCPENLVAAEAAAVAALRGCPRAEVTFE